MAVTTFQPGPRLMSGDHMNTNFASVLPLAGGTMTGPTYQTATNGVTAFSGGGQSGPTAANGALVGTSIFRVTTVAAGGDSIRLPASVAGATIVVINADASHSMNVFPATGEAINTGAANAAYALAFGKAALLVCAVAGTWNAILSA